MTRPPLTIHKLLDLRAVGDVDVSADGGRIAFTVRPSTHDARTPSAADIWIRTGDTAPSQATWGTGDDVLPRWSPDGTVLAFASDRGGSELHALHLLDLAGEARPCGEVPGEVDGIRWADDGGSLLMLAAEAGSGRATVQGATRIETDPTAGTAPIVHRACAGWRRLYRVDVASGEMGVVSPPDINVWEFDWHSGDLAVAVVSPRPAEGAWSDANLATLDLARVEARMVHSPEWQLQSPALRRDYSGLRGLETICGCVTLDGAVAELWSGAATLGGSQRWAVAGSSDGAILAGWHEAPDAPLELAALDTTASEPAWHRLTSFNDRFNDRFAGRRGSLVTRVAWECDGLAIEGLLALPDDHAQTPLPLDVVAPGGPTSAWTDRFDLGDWHAGLLLPEHGYAVFLPKPRGSSGRGQDFARANLGHLGGGDLRDILVGVQMLVAAGTIDPARVAIAGGSHGGFLSAWAITQTDAFAASVPWACISDWLSLHHTSNIGRFDEVFLDADPSDAMGDHLARSPVMHARGSATPTLILRGELDRCTPVGQATELHQALVANDCEAEPVAYPRAGHHWSSREYVVDTFDCSLDWFERHLK